jgi:DNA-binding transcriptional ArsR family regulator
MGINYVITYVEDTKKYGPVKSLIIGVVKNWCNINKDKKGYVYEGYSWSGHITAKEMSEQTGMSIRTVEKNLKQLIDDKILIAGNFNKYKNDRTYWYRPNTLIADMQIPLERISKYPDSVSANTLIADMQIPLERIPLPNNPPINQPKNQKLLINANNTGILGNLEKKEYYFKKIVEIFPKINIIKLIESGDKNTLIATIGKDKYENYSQLFEEYDSIKF